MTDFAKLIEKYSETNLYQFNQVCEPVFEKLGVNYFNYENISKTGHFNTLTTRPDWLHYFGEKLFRTYSPFHIHSDNILPGLYWSKMVQVGNFDSDVMNPARNFKIDQIFYIIEKNSVGHEKYTFGFHSKRAELGFLICREVDLLKKFIVFFKQKFARLIQKTQEDPLDLIAEKGPAFFNTLAFSPCLLSPQTRLSVLDRLGVVEPFLHTVPLSKRELECLRFKLIHKTAAETAQALGLSVRTIEHYMDNVRLKLNVKDKASFVSKIEQLHLIGRI